MKKTMIVALCMLLAAVSVFAAWKDGTWTAKESKADQRGYVAEIRLTVKGGVVTKAEYNEAAKGKSKWNDKSYNDAMKKMAGISWVDAVNALYKSMLEKQDPAKVDAVSGATELHERFVALAGEALAKAK